MKVGMTVWKQLRGILNQMIKKETTYTITLNEIKMMKLLHLVMNNVDGELWDNDLESIYYAMKENVDTQKFNEYMSGEIE
jgi:hypothetical protein